MSRQKRAQKALRPVLGTPPTQADLDAQRRRVRALFFGTWFVFAVVTLVLWVGTTLELTPPAAFGLLAPGGALVVLFSFLGFNPWSVDNDWMLLEGSVLPKLKEIFDSTAVDAVAVKQYRQAVASMDRPLVRADLRRVARHQYALRIWLESEAIAQEVAAYAAPTRPDGTP
ncbi:hypothetical protein [Burkholderia glumae]|uniref:hypothetical protein n=1 Tax=Burkholderia glumae TaxID=337 RepID=UPI00215081E0|nr:hypothetical protein [Burkholderia glumae]